LSSRSGGCVTVTDVVRTAEYMATFYLSKWLIDWDEGTYSADRFGYRPNLIFKKNPLRN